GRGGEGEGRDEHRLTAPEAERRQRQVEGRGARVDGHRMRRPDVASEGRLERLHPWSGRDPPGAERLDDGGDVLVVDVRPKERYVGHGSARRDADASGPEARSRL